MSDGRIAGFTLPREVLAVEFRMLSFYYLPPMSAVGLAGVAGGSLLTGLYWLQCAACGGDSMSLLSAEAPDVVELFDNLGLRMLFHPSLSNLSNDEQGRLKEDLLAGRRDLDILVVEGAVIRGPAGTGMYDTHRGHPRKDLVVALARQARYVVAAGTCASFGGCGGYADAQAVGLQFQRGERGGLLGSDFLSRAGVPVINLAGCPCHTEVIAGTLAALAGGAPLELDRLQRPKVWFSMTVHQGCTRNEYHEYRVEETDFGDRGCLFFHMGCHGPIAAGPCNKTLWNRRSSKTRVGVPCFGCTSPDFPPAYPFFETDNIEGIPIRLPDGVSRAHYMVYKGMAAAAAPKRLTKRRTNV